MVDGTSVETAVGVGAGSLMATSVAGPEEVLGISTDAEYEGVGALGNVTGASSAQPTMAVAATNTNTHR
jgi:hypothetical protein